jgi:prophage regulatory protein
MAAGIPRSRIMRMPEVLEKIGLSRAQVYVLLDEKSLYFDATFPVAIPLTTASVGWDDIEIQEWINSRKALRSTRSKY